MLRSRVPARLTASAALSQLPGPVAAGLLASLALIASPLAYAGSADEHSNPRSQAQMAAEFLVSREKMADELARSPEVMVAEIGGRPITRGDVSDAFRARPATDGNRPVDAVYHDVVQQLLGQEALAIRAREQHMDRDPIEARRMVMAADHELGEAFLSKAVASAISEPLLRDTYDREIRGKPGPEEVDARVIVALTRSDAEGVEKELARGADFADLAHRASRDVSASVGGEIGFVRQDQVSPAIGAVMFALAPGQTTAFPVEVGGVWFVIKVEARRQLAPPSFDEARPQLTQELMRLGVPTVMQKVMEGLPVHDYGIAGNAGSSAPVQGEH